MKLSDIKKKNKKAKIKTLGFIAYKGLSPVNNKPIVLILTMESKNGKTGNMIQSWILEDDKIKPHDLVKQKKDNSICGDCSLKSGGGCYVRVEQAPLIIYKAYKQGKYKQLSFNQLSAISHNRKIRLGSYGDPAMIPFKYWEQICLNSISNTGYTSQYKQAFFDFRITKYCMLSTKTIEEAKKYNDMGYRTFTPIQDKESFDPITTLICPNTTHNIQCIDCMLCNGGNIGKHIIAPIHGLKHKVIKFVINRGF